MIWAVFPPSPPAKSLLPACKVLQLALLSKDDTRAWGTFSPEAKTQEKDQGHINVAVASFSRSNEGDRECQTPAMGCSPAAVGSEGSTGDKTEFGCPHAGGFELPCHRSMACVGYLGSHALVQELAFYSLWVFRQVECFLPGLLWMSISSWSPLTHRSPGTSPLPPPAPGVE